MKWYEVGRELPDLCEEWCMFLFNRHYKGSDNYYQIVTSFIVQSVLDSNIKDKRECLKNLPCDNWITSIFKDSLRKDLPPVAQILNELTEENLYNELVSVSPMTHTSMCTESIVGFCIKKKSLLGIEEFLEGFNAAALIDDQLTFALVCGIRFMEECLHIRRYNKDYLIVGDDGLIRYKHRIQELDREWFKEPVSEASVNVVFDFEFSESGSKRNYAVNNLCRFLAAQCQQAMSMSTVDIEVYSEFKKVWDDGGLYGNVGVVDVMLRLKNTDYVTSHDNVMLPFEECGKYSKALNDIYYDYIGYEQDDVVGTCLADDPQKLFILYVLSGDTLFKNLGHKNTAVWFCYFGNDSAHTPLKLWFDNSGLLKAFLATWYNNDAVRDAYDNHIMNFMRIIWVSINPDEGLASQLMLAMSSLRRE